MSGTANTDRVLVAARELAAANRHGFVGTEHLLAALLRDGDGLAATMLSSAGLDPERISAGLLKGLRQTSAEDPGAEPGPSRFAEQALERAAAAATAAGRESVEDRDLLTVLLAQPKGRTAQLLRGDGKSLVALQAALGIEGAPDRPVPPAGAAGKPPREPREAKTESRPDRKAARELRQERRPEAKVERPVRADPRGERGSRPVRPESVERRERGEPELPPLRIARPDPPRPFPWSMLLLLAVPASIVLNYLNAAPLVVFVTACVAVLPLAGLMGDATESLADRTGPTLGGLLNATFGNAAELIIALFALNAGLLDLVKASITGSILGNLLLILGLSFIASGTQTPVVKFSRTNAGMSAAMLALAVIGLMFPALFHAAHGPANSPAELYLSEAVSVILIVTYLFSLLFSLKTHKALFAGGDHPAIEPRWGVTGSVAVLVLATIGVVIESEMLVHAIGPVTATLGLSQTFLGLVIIPIIGNAAEHATAVVVARRGQIDLAIQIALGSSTQVALLVAPILVFAGLALGAGMNLVFPVFDVAALAVSTIVIAIITLDGETHWFEGVQLLAVYAMMAAAAYFI